MFNSHVSRVIRHIDLPGHDGVVRTVRFADHLAIWLRAACTCVSWLALMYLLDIREPNLLLGVGAVSFVVTLFDGYVTITQRHLIRAMMFSAFVGGVIGAYVGATEAGDVLAMEKGLSALIRMGIGAFIGLFVPLILYLAGTLIALFGTPLTVIASIPVMGAIKLWMRVKYPAWRTARGKGLLKFNHNGLAQVRTHELADRRVYVNDPATRCEGGARQAGVLKLNYQELFSRDRQGAIEAHHLATAGAMAAGAAGAALVMDLDDDPGRYWREQDEEASRRMSEEMMESAIGSHGGMGGMSDFMDTNPATGLATTGGMGTVDVGGNDWGTIGSWDDRY